jgi:hypothetical protein
MLFSETVAFYCENHMECTEALRVEKIFGSLLMNPSIRVITTVC